MAKCDRNKLLRNRDTGVVFHYEPYMASLSNMEVVKDNPPGESLNNIAWHELKKRVVAQGGKWTNKKDAIEFLSR